ncbi:MAG: hypothetical protein EB127_16885 [Alphaproteobacteria bacterium]|nr:hypothetical protein [Alphaproteobacteria bacterium]
MAKKTNTPETMATSDFNMEKLSTKELEQHLDASIKAGSNVAIFGRRGSGKTQISKQAIAKSGSRELYINLSVFERTDMGGYPNIMGHNNKSKYIDFLMPQMYEALMEGDKPVVALLDEVDKADPSVWAPLLEFTQFHTINGRELKNLQAVVMTGNLLSEGGNRPCMPLLDRAEKYLVEADATSWLEWAGRSGKIHPAITAYITDHPKDLFGAVDPEDRYADPSPRGWAGASELLFVGEKNGWNTEVLNKKVCGRVGKDAGIKYSNYYEHYQVLLPMVDRIYEGKDVSAEFNKLEPTKRLVGSMIACARLANQLDSHKGDKLPKSVDYIGKFLKGISYENVLVAVRSQIQLERILKYSLDEHPEWEALINNMRKKVSA